ncbi:MAG: AAA family ATPase [Alphaproteobacteria bacterium]|nr:AAA family ATPase [Alphaproteobacteria bacterium]
MAQEIREWLEGLGLGDYAKAFEENALGIHLLPSLTDEDLREIGVAKLGHRKELLKAIVALSAQETTKAVAPASEVIAAARSEAERRQLTVMFVDLVGSTALSSKLDPEDLREVMRRYQDAVAGAVTRYAGHVAKYLGDGVLVYFGWPQAHEDQAERAVRAGLDAVSAVSGLKLDGGVELQARAGIATGQVVIGDLVGEAGRDVEAVSGEAPNLAARLQDQAKPDQVVIGATTRNLIGETFALEELKTRVLKGFADPVRVWRVVGEQATESRFEAAHSGRLTNFVGRQEEVGLLHRRWEQAKQGEGQVVLLAGEAGIGKSRITQMLGERLAEEPHMRLRYQCSPHHANTAFHPFIQQLAYAAGFTPDDTAEQKLDKIEALLAQSSHSVAEVAPLFAALLSVPTADRYPPLEVSPERQKDLTLAALSDQLIGLAGKKPIVVVFEDAHWADPTSLEALEQVMERIQGERVLTVITYRPEFSPPWRGYTHITSLALSRLGRDQCATMVANVTQGRALPGEVLDQIVSKTDGIPLFVEELTKTVLESGLLREVGDRYQLTGPLPPVAIPSTLQDSLMARLDRLAPVKEVAQIGAAIGREFPHRLLAAVSPMGDSELHGALGQLVEAELVFRRGSGTDTRYIFKHALVQDAAYESLLRSKRQELHQRIATVLEEQFPNVVETEPEILAHHYTEAGQIDASIPYWRRAGQRAVDRSANLEAIIHLGKALQLVAELPEAAERDRQELAIQIALGPALMAVKGWGAPEVERTYFRARELCRDVAEPSQLFTVLWGLWLFHHMRGQFRPAKDLADEILALAERQSDSGLLLQAYHAAWTTDFYFGDFLSCRSHAQHGIALYDIDEHRAHASIYGGHDVGVCCRETLATALWLLGYPDQAVEKNHDAVGLATELSHPFSLVLALHSSAEVHQHRREPRFTQERAEAMIAVCTEHDISPEYSALGTIRRGWAVAAEGRHEQGIADIQQGLTTVQAAGATRSRTYLLALLAEVFGQTGKAEQGLKALAEALEIVEKTDVRWWEAEVHRLTGELLLSRPAQDTAVAEECFNRAIAVAQGQSAKSLELRAATSLARLWRDQSRAAEARDLLAPVYGWFTEGFDTADLKEAKTLLDELS